MFLRNKKRLLAWQNIILEKPYPKLITTEFDLIIITGSIIKNDYKIIYDSLDLLNTTINPDIFFKRLNLIYNELEYLSKLKSFIITKNESSLYLFDYHKEQYLIFNFLKNYFSSVLEKISVLKTNKSKINKLQGFFNSLENYKYYMNNENINYYTELYNISIKNYV